MKGTFCDILVKDYNIKDIRYIWYYGYWLRFITPLSPLTSRLYFDILKKTF